LFPTLNQIAGYGIGAETNLWRNTGDRNPDLLVQFNSEVINAQVCDFQEVAATQECS
jgi:hypothetical protein